MKPGPFYSIAHAAYRQLYCVRHYVHPHRMERCRLIDGIWFLEWDTLWFLLRNWKHVRWRAS